MEAVVADGGDADAAVGLALPEFALFDGVVGAGVRLALEPFADEGDVVGGGEVPEVEEQGGDLVFLQGRGGVGAGGVAGDFPMYLQSDMPILPEAIP